MAAFLPSSVRLRMRDRSNCAIPAKTVMIITPDGDVVSAHDGAGDLLFEHQFATGSGKPAMLASIGFVLCAVAPQGAQLSTVSEDAA